MHLTIDIIVHELKSLGEVTEYMEGSLSFNDVRLFVAERDKKQDALYVCATADEADSICSAGANALQVIDIGDDLEKSASAYATIVIRTAFSALMVFDALLDIFHRYDDWERAMERISHTGGGLQELLDASEPFLMNNVVVLDSALKLIAYTKSVPCDDPITVELIEHGYHTEDNIRKFRLHKRFKSWSEDEGFIVNDTHEICKYTTVVKSFKARTSFSLISVMMCNVAEPEPYLLDIFNLFVEQVNLYARRDYPDGKPSGNAIDAFLKDLISGEVDDAAAIERCQFVNLPYKAQFCLFYLKAGENSVPSSRLLADVSLVVAPAKTILVDDAVVVLCFNCLNVQCGTRCVMQECTCGRMTISRRLNEMLERYDLTCGKSSKFTLLSQAATAFEQAKEAYAIGRRTILAAGRNAQEGRSRIFTFDEYGDDYLVHSLSERDLRLLRATYAGTIIATLAEQDAVSNTDNFEFLHAYLEYERRTSIVAEKLHMHRNNVNYRINRIQEQFGMDVGDARLRSDLLFAYRLWIALHRNT